MFFCVSFFDVLLGLYMQPNSSVVALLSCRLKDKKGTGLAPWVYTITKVINYLGEQVKKKNERNNEGGKNTKKKEKKKKRV